MCRQVKIRKMQLTFDPKNNKPVTSLERMPRAYRALADRNAKVCAHACAHARACLPAIKASVCCVHERPTRNALPRACQVCM